MRIVFPKWAVVVLYLFALVGAPSAVLLVYTVACKVLGTRPDDFLAGYLAAGAVAFIFWVAGKEIKE